MTKVQAWLTRWHEMNSRGEKRFPIISVQEIFSEAGCRQQPFHQDCPAMNPNLIRKGQKRILTNTNFSCLIALEEASNPTRIMYQKKTQKGQEEGVYVIPQGAMAIWRGDFTHAGASYDQDNRRLFISISSKENQESLEEITIVRPEPEEGTRKSKRQREAVTNKINSST
ncbi:MAG: hypothetical protein ACH350_10540 [Parachlamydiaceae bacterium]